MTWLLLAWGLVGWIAAIGAALSDIDRSKKQERELEAALETETQLLQVQMECVRLRARLHHADAVVDALGRGFTHLFEGDQEAALAVLGEFADTRGLR